ncbi:MAG: ROK family transcriptional regulator [Acidobacteriota bacterium]
MEPESVFRSDLFRSTKPNKKSQILSLIRAAQPITRTEIAERLAIDKSTVAEDLTPLIKSGVLLEASADVEGQNRRARVLSFAPGSDYFIGVNLGVRHSQVGITTLTGDIADEDDFETPKDPKAALRAARERISGLATKHGESGLKMIGVSVPGMTDADRQTLVFAPNLEWRSVDIANALRINDSAGVVVENDSNAAAMYEARTRINNSQDASMTNFILVRSGTGIGVGLVIGGEVYRGTGIGRGMAGEFGHMTIVAGGKPCVCGNRGCWEKYASAASAAWLYLGDRPPARHENIPRFVEIVSKAENGDTRSRRTLEKIGEYLGIGIANVIMGVGIPRVIVSGRLVYGWDFIKQPLREAIGRSIVGKMEGWSVEAGEPAGAAIGGALEVAVEEYLSTL